MEQDKRYLGDGVYCWSDGFQIWLETQRANGSHCIALEDMVLQQLDIFRKELAKKGAAHGK